MPQFFRRSLKVNLSFVQIGNAISDVKRVFHVMGHDDAGHAETLLQSADQTIDGIGNDRIESGGRLVIENTRWLTNDGAREANALFHSAAQIDRHFFFLPLQLHHFEHLANAFAQNFRVAFAGFA